MRVVALTQLGHGSLLAHVFLQSGPALSYLSGDVMK